MATVDHSQTTGRATVPDWLRQGETRLRLQTIVRLRWLAVLGQSVTVVGAYWVLGIDLPIGGCLAIIALSAWLNVALAHPLPGEPTAQVGLCLRHARLRHPPARRPALFDRRPGEPVRLPADRAGHRLGLDAAAQGHRRARRAHHHRGDGAHQLSSPAAVVPSFEPAAPVSLRDGGVGGGGIRHPVHRLLFVAHGGRGAAHGQGLGRRRDGAGARAEIVGARRSGRGGGARSRHAARDHRRGDQGDDARRQAVRPALRGSHSAQGAGRALPRHPRPACRRRRAAGHHRVAAVLEPPDRGGGGAAPPGRGADRSEDGTGAGWTARLRSR